MFTDYNKLRTRRKQELLTYTTENPIHIQIRYACYSHRSLSNTLCAGDVEETQEMAPHTLQFARAIYGCSQKRHFRIWR
jgi:hypothetical protein